MISKATHIFFYSVESAGSSSTFYIRDFSLEHIQKIVALIIHLFAYRATLRAEQVSQIHSMDGCTRLLIKLSMSHIYHLKGLFHRKSPIFKETDLKKICNKMFGDRINRT